MLLVRSYRTFAPLPVEARQAHLYGRYFSVALSSRSLALGVTQQVWSLGCPDFPRPIVTSTISRNCRVDSSLITRVHRDG
jgi:hypothetical protein